MELIATPQRAMAISAHPDDAEIEAGATLAKWSAAGCRIALVVCSDGAAGGESSREKVARQRQEEQGAAASVLGVERLEMLGLPDGGIEETSELRGAIVRLIREFRPDVILTHDHHAKRAFVHRDHRVVGTVVHDAIFPYARDPLHYPEQIAGGLAPHKASELLLWGSDEPDSAVDVAGYGDSKIDAIEKHASQLPGLFGPTPWREQLRESTQERFRRMIAPL